jgi:hypothetical protein
VLCCVLLARSLTIMTGLRAVLPPMTDWFIWHSQKPNFKQYKWDKLFGLPCITVFSGPSSCGKTEFAKQVAKDIFKSTLAHDVYWYYAEHRPDLHRELYKFVEFREGIVPSFDDYDGYHTPVIIIDDSMSDRVSEIAKFVGDERNPRKKGVSMIVMVENFLKSEELKAIADNSDYIMLFKGSQKEEEEEQIKYMADRLYADVRKYSPDLRIINENIAQRFRALGGRTTAGTSRTLNCIHEPQRTTQERSLPSYPNPRSGATMPLQWVRV